MDPRVGMCMYVYETNLLLKQSSHILLHPVKQISEPQAREIRTCSDCEPLSRDQAIFLLLDLLEWVKSFSFPTSQSHSCHRPFEFVHEAWHPSPHLCSFPRLFFSFLFFFFFFFVFSRAAPTAHGGSQARGLIGAVAAGLRQSHSNLGSELHLRPAPQLTATPDP